MTETEKQLAYCIRRLEMWGLGYGSYSEIDAAVTDGRLTPGVIPKDHSRKSIFPEAKRTGGE